MSSDPAIATALASIDPSMSVLFQALLKNDNVLGERIDKVSVKVEELDRGQTVAR